MTARGTDAARPALTHLDELRDEPAQRPAGTVIWLHGMGHDAHSMRVVARAAGLVGDHLRNVYLQAPIRRIGLIRPRDVRAWIQQSVTRLDSADRADLVQIVRLARPIIDRELDLVGDGRVVLAGFSQGAAMSLLLGLSHPRPLAGIAGYATLPPGNILPARSGTAGSNVRIPIWLGHGDQDWAVRLETGRSVRDSLRQRGHPVQWHEYPAGHEPFEGAGPQVSRFVRDVLAPGR